MSTSLFPSTDGDNLRDEMFPYLRRGLFAVYKTHSMEQYVALLERLIAE